MLPHIVLYVTSHRAVTLKSVESGTDGCLQHHRPAVARGPVF